jgi:hypothetical protein
MTKRKPSKVWSCKVKGCKSPKPGKGAFRYCVEHKPRRSRKKKTESAHKDSEEKLRVSFAQLLEHLDGVYDREAILGYFDDIVSDLQPEEVPSASRAGFVSETVLAQFRAQIRAGYEDVKRERTELEQQGVIITLPDPSPSGGGGVPIAPKEGRQGALQADERRSSLVELSSRGEGKPRNVGARGGHLAVLPSRKVPQ